MNFWLNFFSITVNDEWSVLLYGAESWELTQRLEHLLRACDRRMLRYMASVSLADRMSSLEVARRCGVRLLEDALRERRLRWFGHVIRRKGEGALGAVLNVEVAGSRRRGRPRKSWLKNMEEDLQKLGLCMADAYDRARWRRLIQRPTP